MKFLSLLFLTVLYSCTREDQPVPYLVRIETIGSVDGTLLI